MDARSARTQQRTRRRDPKPRDRAPGDEPLDDISADGSYRLSLDAHDRIVWSSGEPERRDDLAHGAGNDAYAALSA